MIFSFLLIFLNTIHAQATTLPSAEQMHTAAYETEWLNLLHYHHKSFFRYQSEIDGGVFFLSEQGRKDPEAELKATIEAIDSTAELGPLKQRPFCIFRARYDYLQKRLGLKYPDIQCEKWNGFYERFNQPQNVSLIFSSAYTNNPASMFGHLFLKISSRRSSDLLDTGVNFAAQVPPDENPLAFFYLGVLGGYEGHWSTQPYYEKLNEYIKAESRDLWEYELDFNADEVRLLIEHLWEIETSARIKYYFFDDNCAYQMMRLFQAVKPQWKKLDEHTIYAIPGEIVKNLFSQEGVVRKVKFRPSLRKKLLQKYSALTEDQTKIFFQLIANKLDPASVSDALVLETASSYFDFQRQLKKGKLSAEETKYWEAILSARSKVISNYSVESLPTIASETRPDLGHDAYSVRLLGGSETALQQSGRGYLGVRVQSAYHDLFNQDAGFKKYSEIQFPWFEIRKRDSDLLSKKTFLEELGFLQITSLAPVSRLDFSPSWKIKTTVESPKDFSCLNCRYFTWSGGVGLSEEVISSDHILYQFLTLRTNVDSQLARGYRLLSGADVGWISSIAEKWKTGVQASYYQDVGSERLVDRFYEVQIKQSISLQKNWEIRQQFQFIYPDLSARPNYAEARLDLAYYFR